MNEFYFNDIWRMDWGLGNPNKTAALIAMLMIASWLFIYIKRWGFWLSVLIFTGLGVCLVHTFSRGGIVALFTGLLPVAWVLWKKRLSKSQIIGLAVSAWILIGSSVYFQAHQRYTQGIIQEDRSITNRLAIWRQAPQMMRDAPGGWGLGKSGYSYVQWYQNLDHQEGYRTLVNSHLTWLVELGWLGRLGYIAAWLGILLICWPYYKKDKKNKKDGKVASNNNDWFLLALGVWLVLGVAAIFSSVAESQWLWVLPALMLLVVLLHRLRTASWPQWQWVFVSPTLAGLSLLLFLQIPGSPRDFDLFYSNGVLKMKSHEDISLPTWVFYEEGVFGKEPGKSVRKYLAQEKKIHLCLVLDPSKAVSSHDPLALAQSHVIAGGKLSEESLFFLATHLENLGLLTFINPEFFPLESMKKSTDTRNKIDVLFGEFFYGSARTPWLQAFAASTSVLEGTGKYYPQWLSLIKSESAAKEVSKI